MTTADIRDRLTDVFRRVFDDDALAIHDATTAKDVPGWDSLNHVNLIVATEREFGVRFTTREVNGLKDVGELIALIQRKLGA